MFSVVTDTSHTAGLTMHATILAYVFALVEGGKVNTKTFLILVDCVNFIHASKSLLHTDVKEREKSYKKIA